MRGFNKKSYNEFYRLLCDNSEDEYRLFCERIIPDLGEAFGIRAPRLKIIVKELSKGDNLKEMVEILHKKDTYEEKLIEGSLISRITYEGVDEMFKYIDGYILRINNWALCDSFVSNLKKLVGKNRESFYSKIKEEYIKSKNPWEIRFGLILLNNYFKDEEYLNEVFEMIEEVKSEHYYVRMGIAWLVSTIYFTDKERVVEFIISDRIDKWCRNKSIQKIIESLRTSVEEKEYLRGLRVK